MIKRTNNKTIRLSFVFKQLYPHYYEEFSSCKSCVIWDYVCTKSLQNVPVIVVIDNCGSINTNHLLYLHELIFVCFILSLIYSPALFFMIEQGSESKTCFFFTFLFLVCVFDIW